MNRLIGIMIFSVGGAISIAATLPSPSPVPLNIPSLTPSVTPSTDPTTKGVDPAPSPISATINKNILMREFLKAQGTELRALEHQQRFELKELKASQDAREKEWNKSEKEARHRYFESHPKGSDRRTYVQDFIQRRDALHKHFIEEKAQKKKEHDTKLIAIRQEQVLRLKDFKEALDKGLTPAPVLWPRSGH